MNGKMTILTSPSVSRPSCLPLPSPPPSLRLLATRLGIAESTLRRWLEDPSFREELARIRQESHSLVRQQIQTAMPTGIAVITELATKGSDEALRLRAARYLVEPRCWEYSRKPRVKRGCRASAPATAAGKLSMTRYLGMPPKNFQAVHGIKLGDLDKLSDDLQDLREAVKGTQDAALPSAADRSGRWQPDC